MLGDKIRFLRESKKLGLNETADLAGISGSYLSTIENGIKKNPSMKTLSKIALALGVSVEELFFNEETKANIEDDYKPVLSVKEQEKLDELGEGMLAGLRIALSQNKGQLSEQDYEMIGATVRTLLEQMTKNNKEKYTPKIHKKKK